jgi:hypothetical protein
MRQHSMEAGLEACWLTPVWIRVGNGMPEIVRGAKGSAGAASVPMACR